MIPTNVTIAVSFIHLNIFGYFFLNLFTTYLIIYVINNNESIVIIHFDI